MSDTQSNPEQWGYNSGQFLDDLVTGKREPSRDNLAIARFASSMMGHQIRMASIKANQERDLLRFAGRLSNNPEELAHYTMAALPNSGFTRMLEAKATAPVTSDA